MEKSAQEKREAILAKRRERYAAKRATQEPKKMGRPRTDHYDAKESERKMIYYRERKARLMEVKS